MVLQAMPGHILKSMDGINITAKKKGITQMKKEKFKVYRKYYELIDTLDEIDKGKMVLAVFDYYFKEEIPVLNEKNMEIFNQIKDMIDNPKKYNLG